MELKCDSASSIPQSSSKFQLQRDIKYEVIECITNYLTQNISEAPLEIDKMVILPVPYLKITLVHIRQSPSEATYHEQLYLQIGWHDLVFDKEY